MDPRFEKIVKYANKAGIYDIELALRMLQAGRLPEDKVKSLEDIKQFAQKNGVNDFGAFAYNFKKQNPQYKDAEYGHAYAMENNLPYNAETRNKIHENLNQMTQESGQNRASIVKDYLNNFDKNYIEEENLNNAGNQQLSIKDRAAIEERNSRNERLDQLHELQRKEYENPEYYRRYWKAATGNKEVLESDPLFGSDAFRENIPKYSPSAITHREDLMNALNKSDLYKNVQNLGRTQLPERQLYNNMLQQYQYEQARRNPLNVLTGRYEYLRPQAYGEESSWVNTLRNKLGFNPVTSFGQKG